MAKQDSNNDWSLNLIDSLWFHIAHYLSLDDIDRLSRTCSRLQTLLTSNDFWSHLMRIHFGSAIWRRFVLNPSVQPLSDPPIESRSKSIFQELTERLCISLADFNQVSLDANRNYTSVTDCSSLNGYVLHIHDSVEFSYSIQIETLFRDVLPGRYDVVWRMKLDLPYILGETDFFAAVDQSDPAQPALTRWTQDDFLAMYRCFHCDLSKTNLWFYQTMGIVEILGDQRGDVYVSMINHDPIHAKHGLFLDFVELKRRLE